MLRQVSITNWQSLRQVDLPLAAFTVIVGPSSSGKTAFIRALTALASNTRGIGDDITRGARDATITARTDHHTVTLHRTKTTGSYHLTDHGTGTTTGYTSTAGAVPEQVTAALGIDPVRTGTASVHIAGQFDSPYLITDTGAAIAHRLGELTNVTVIFAAADEALRRRNRHAATLRTRESDLARLRTQAEAYRDLPAQLAACDRAEAHAERATILQERITRLAAIITAADGARAVLTRTAPLRELPDGTAMSAAHQRLAVFRGRVRDWIAAQRAAAAATAAVDQAAAAETDLHAQVHAALTAAGICPTCERPVTP